MDNPPCILFMSTFPPRECGLATFTDDLTGAMENNFSNKFRFRILAMNKDVTNMYDYPKKVLLQINDTDIQEYIDAAKHINRTESIKLVSIQHEFGIFGGRLGDYLIPFLEILKKPVVITFHSVIPNPSNEMKRIVQSLANKTSCFVVMAKKAVDILRKDYEISTDIAVIPHGIPTVPLAASAKEKSKMNFSKRTILSTFGMMSKDKGYEYVIGALPKLIKKHPDLLYLIIGQTHPVVRKREGEKYRNHLENMVKKLGLHNHVKFYNKYLSLKEILRFLQATDLYISPCLNPNQITSGTLAYALGSGRAVVSTPFLHAQEAVTQDRGLLVEFRNPGSYAAAISRILSEPAKKLAMEKKAYEYTRNMRWPNVAEQYVKIFDKYISGKKALPELKLDHLIHLTDDFGILQFAKGTTPDTESGYTLDDNARALITCCMYYNIYNDESVIQLIEKYLKSIEHVLQEDGRLFNNIKSNREVDTDEWSEDAHSRGIWALGYLISSNKLPQKMREKAKEIFHRSLEPLNFIKSPRSAAFSIIGLYHYNQIEDSAEALEMIRKLAGFLVSCHKNCSTEEWQWFEEYLTYSNSKLPEALLYSYLATGNEEHLRIAKASLGFLKSVTFENGIFAPIGQDGWYFMNGKKAHYDQQPVDAASMVQTLILAHNICDEKSYMDKANYAFSWFLGRNYLNKRLYDPCTGGCHDGLGRNSINLNQGAESTISYLMARLNIEEAFAEHLPEKGTMTQ
ncbi:glycosyltransferase family 4 protein [Candidatus Woesearchaeota archaeon]|nr:glycosyltransferase family 4 protein [Candidatus Woesearchaeota archaeon]